MATQAQCFYCFECLSASFDDREPPPLSKVEGLWEEYQKSLPSENEISNERPEERPSEEDSAVEDIEATDGEESPDEDDEDGEEDDEEDEEDDTEDDTTNHAATTLTQPTPRPQVPSISRLQASTPSSHSSSSSTPSTLSANSSNTALTTPASSTTSIPHSPSISTSNHAPRPTSSSRLTQTQAPPSYPLFITWNTLTHPTNPTKTSQKALRGCIGTFDPLPLPTGLKLYALTSAFEDTRFPPIPSHLLPSLSCSLTLLADFEPCSHPLDWTLGTHGLRISFVHRGKRLGATYLPDVAVEQGWGREETVESLMRKAGWDGGSGGGGLGRRLLRGARADAGDGGRGGRHPWEEVGDFRTTRYTGLKASAIYGEWMGWRRWVEGRYGGGVLRW